MNGPSSRLLQLLSLLQARRDWPGEELAKRLGVSPRTIRRDVERLRELGYPVEAHTGPDGGYRLRSGTAMPPLLLDDEEAVAIAVGLRTAAGASVAGIEETSLRALVKLEQVLPDHLRRRIGALEAVTVVPQRGSGPAIDADALTLIASTCRDHEQLRFDYRARDGAETRRRVEPHALVKLGRRWYLVAWCLDRQAWRTFRVDRIGRPAADGRRFTERRLPQGGDAAAFVAANLSGAVYRYQARITLHASAEEVAAQVPRIASALTPNGPRSCEYRTSDDDLDWLAIRVGMLGFDFEVHEPPELAEHFRVLAARFAAGAGGG